VTPAADAISRIDKAIATGRGAYLTAEQVRALAAVIRGLAKQADASAHSASLTGHG
jgi:hypothetical protein